MKGTSSFPLAANHGSAPTTHKSVNPDTLAAPVGAYSLGLEVEPSARWLYVSGQTGMAPDGTVPHSVLDQTKIAWSNIAAICDCAEMCIADIVKTIVCLTGREHMVAYREGRPAFADGRAPVSSIVIVGDLADSRCVVEIEVVAAKA